MSGALIQLMANETFEDQQDFHKRMALAGILFFAIVTSVWILLIPKKV